ncbi:MAG: hypothetical protein NTZ59_14340 [Bacteroidetes bacterium]|nr:hypothetical protein [Bacteroidota bacterium]
MIIEKYFDYGIEGGGETLYKCTKADGSIYFATSGSSLYIDENDLDSVRTWEKEYPTFEAFWQKFSQIGMPWFYFYPIYIHNDIKEIIRTRLQVFSEVPEYIEYKKHNWERALDKDNAL